MELLNNNGGVFIESINATLRDILIDGNRIMGVLQFDDFYISNVNVKCLHSILCELRDRRHDGDFLSWVEDTDVNILFKFSNGIVNEFNIMNGDFIIFSSLVRSNKIKDDVDIVGEILQVT